jgi:hypothetical protein
MAPPDPIGLDCPECGASNRAGDSLCFLCGHGLDTARPETRTGVPESPASPTSPELVNPYRAPTTMVSSALTFRISSLLMVIAVIAVCLGVVHENMLLGITLAVVVAPALVYTSIVAAKRKVRGRPMAVLEKVWTFLAAAAGVVLVALSAVIAFFVTCIPVSIGTVRAGGLGFIIGLVTGGTAAVAAAACVTYLLLTRNRRRARTRQKP